jgi:hypothetical protein
MMRCSRPSDLTDSLYMIIRGAQVMMSDAEAKGSPPARPARSSADKSTRQPALGDRDRSSRRAAVDLET